MTDWMQHAFPTWIVLASLVGLAFGVLIGRLDRPRLLASVSQLEADLARAESQAREQVRQVTRLQSEQRAIAKFSRVVPQIASDLNNAELDERDIPKLVFDLVDSLFEPEQSLLYLARAAEAGSDGGPYLQLVDRRGKAEIPAALNRVNVGVGRIGWVAEARVEMLADDWLNMTRLEGRSIENNHPGLRADLLGPLVVHERSNDTLLGVLCISGPATRPRDEKLMLQTVTNLATIAFTNARSVRALRSQANFDGLTGLLNKREFMSKSLGALINAAETGNQPLCVFVFDIDHFKTYNDTNGHLAGDEILRGVAQVLRANLRPGDLACRYGGEEFIVAMPGTSRNDGMIAADRIRAAIAHHPFPKCSTQPLGHLSISGGVAQFPVDGTLGKQLIEHADNALYDAKRKGRNRVFPYQGVDIGTDADEPHWLPHADTVDER